MEVLIYVSMHKVLYKLVEISFHQSLAKATEVYAGRNVCALLGKSKAVVCSGASV
jgi:hypothetical protein